MCLKRKKKVKEAEKSDVTAVENLLLKVMYMRGTFEYEIICDDGEATVSKFRIVYENGEGRRKLRGSANLQVEDVCTKLNEFEISKWNGFFGKHPKNVSDGVMFDLTATLNGDKKLHAEGSENFPPHYHDLVRWFDELTEKD